MKNILITGASSGLGYQLSKDFIFKGYNVFCLGRNVQKLKALNINLEIIKIDSYSLFFKKIFLKKNFSIYWNKTYEPNYLKLDNYLSQKF